MAAKVSACPARPQPRHTKVEPATDGCVCRPARRQGRCDWYCGVDVDHLHAGQLGLVGDELAQLIERPGMQRGALGLAEP